MKVSFHKTRPNYSNVSSKFIDFKDFAEWTQSQYGLMNKDENGAWWHIDKDLLGGKEYSKSSCIFVPLYVNNLFTSRSNHRGKYPIGVTKSSRNKTKPYASRLNNGGGNRVGLGYFKTPEEAHKAWQIAKINRILEITRNKDIDGHLVLKNKLKEIADFIQWQHDNDIISNNVLVEFYSED